MKGGTNENNSEFQKWVTHPEDRVCLVINEYCTKYEHFLALIKPYLLQGPKTLHCPQILAEHGLSFHFSNPLKIVQIFIDFRPHKICSKMVSTAHLAVNP